MKKVFAIRDCKVAVYLRPFFEENEIQAVRGIQSHMQSGQSQLNQFPADFELYHLGDYDDVTGKIINLDYPKFIISCHSIHLNMLKAAELNRKLEDAALMDQEKK